VVRQEKVSFLQIILQLVVPRHDRVGAGRGAWLRAWSDILGCRWWKFVALGPRYLLLEMDHDDVETLLLLADVIDSVDEGAHHFL
jgi:hypothetical protein